VKSKTEAPDEVLMRTLIPRGQSPRQTVPSRNALFVGRSSRRQDSTLLQAPFVAPGNPEGPPGSKA
jgi:hypothetical protein